MSTEFDGSGVPISATHADQTVDYFDAHGTIVRTVFSNGDTEFRQADGSRRRVAANGTILSIVVDDVPAQSCPDGTWEALNAENTLFRYREDGTPLAQIYADGSHREFEAGGDIRYIGIDGTTTLWQTDGTVVEVVSDVLLKDGQPLLRDGRPISDVFEIDKTIAGFY
ncbi:MAG: hypothetical protein FJX76_20980 [Armatimonadetes bacterium]|nr:hypothetical protein [Armatimonadota bacterium]